MYWKGKRLSSAGYVRRSECQLTKTYISAFCRGGGGGGLEIDHSLSWDSFSTKACLCVLANNLVFVFDPSPGQSSHSVSGCSSRHFHPWVVCQCQLGFLLFFVFSTSLIIVFFSLTAETRCWDLIGVTWLMNMPTQEFTVRSVAVSAIFDNIFFNCCSIATDNRMKQWDVFITLCWIFFNTVFCYV